MTPYPTGKNNRSTGPGHSPDSKKSRGYQEGKVCIDDDEGCSAPGKSGPRSRLRLPFSARASQKYFLSGHSSPLKKNHRSKSNLKQIHIESYFAAKFRQIGARLH
jgi:hypothetical protein